MDKTRSEPSTAPGSPAESDDEEYEADVDYDDVLAIIDTRRAGPGSPRGKKRTGRSYRDLASLGSPTSPTGNTIPLPKADDEGLQRLTMRKGVKSQTSDNEDAEEQADTTREKKE
jgi:glycerol-3-phosphate O-acyltransferase/dihydroxyacetone phosphate acyltransferase